MVTDWYVYITVIGICIILMRKGSKKLLRKGREKQRWGIVKRKASLTDGYLLNIAIILFINE